MLSCDPTLLTDRCQTFCHAAPVKPDVEARPVIDL